jgi:hypothetical protein
MTRVGPGYTAVALDWWLDFWTAIMAIGTVGTLAFLSYQLLLLRRDRQVDYLRKLIPFLSMDLYSDSTAIALDRIPIRLHADGEGIAYGVIINLASSEPKALGTTVIRNVRVGSPGEGYLPGHLPTPFGGDLELVFTDAYGKHHKAWQSVNSASGPLKVTDWLHWYCDDCRVHPYDKPPTIWHGTKNHT